MTAAAVEPIRAVRRLRRRDLPELLQQIHDPPRALFLRGAADTDILALPAVAIVGARACSPYGAQVARMLGRELAAAGLVVVSGLARGIDGEAHRGALDAGGLTVAVLVVASTATTRPPTPSWRGGSASEDSSSRSTSRASSLPLGDSLHATGSLPDLRP